MHVAIAVHHLLPFYHGSTEHGPEYPPSPWRLYCAVVAGLMLRESKLGIDRIRSTAQWFERLSPPTIFAPESTCAGRYGIQAPPNDADKAPGVIGQKFLSKTALQSEHPCWFVWDAGDVDPGHLETLREGVRGLYALGLGIDQAFADLRVGDLNDVIALSSEHSLDRWDPQGLSWRDGDTVLRAPVEGSFEGLQSVHAMRLQDGPWQQGDGAPLTRIGYGRCPRRRWRMFELHDERGRTAIPQRDACTVAAMVRHEVMEMAKAEGVSDEKINRYFRGYIPQEMRDHRNRYDHRLSYVPLPSVGHKFADGMIRRVLVVEPRGAPDLDFDKVVTRLNGRKITSTDGRFTFTLEMPAGRDRSYTSTAREWVSVTPVVLPGQDDHDRHQQHRLAMLAIEHAGYSGLVDTFELSRVPVLHSSHMPGAYWAPSYLRKRSRYFMRVRFRRDVRGPVTIGDGRHVGLGVFSAD